jgi:hypothetical protein
VGVFDVAADYLNLGAERDIDSPGFLAAVTYS